MNAPVRRTMSPWETAPRDGTPFHILNTLRFNPFADRFESLHRTDEGAKWHGINIGENEPSLWLRRVPLPYDVPTSLAFTVAYSVRPKTWRERLIDRLLTIARPLLKAAASSASPEDTTLNDARMEKGQDQ